MLIIDSRIHKLCHIFYLIMFWQYITIVRLFALHIQRIVLTIIHTYIINNYDIMESIENSSLQTPRNISFTS